MSKSNKIKGGTTSKKAQFLKEELRRKSGVRDLEKRFLIVCEDNKSAVNYFNAFIAHFKLPATSVRVAGSKGYTQPMQVVERAIEIQERAGDPDSGTEPYDHVWCVIDGDYGNKIGSARDKANANKIELAITTKCFEYWILLHFEESASSTINCDALIKTLKTRHLPNYTKGKFDFKAIVAKVRVASQRAEKLRKAGIPTNELPEFQNPCSEIYKLINLILKD